jgi:hypothetical protein
MALRKFALAAIFLLCAAVIPALAQGPLQKRINFTVNVPFELGRANIVLPPGNYVLFQINRREVWRERAELIKVERNSSGGVAGNHEVGQIVAANREVKSHGQQPVR